MASSEQYSSGLIEIQTQWSIMDVLDANDVLDAFAMEQERAVKEAQRGHK